MNEQQVLQAMVTTVFNNMSMNEVMSVVVAVSGGLSPSYTLGGEKVKQLLVKQGNRMIMPKDTFDIFYALYKDKYE